MDRTIKQDCLEIFKAGVDAVDPYKAIQRYLHINGDDLIIAGSRFNLSNFEHIYIIGAGKATAAMALAVEEALGARLDGGFIIVKYGHTANLTKTELVEAGHPVPDEAGFKAAQKLEKTATGFGPHDLVLCLMSGGGSALLPLPVAGVTLQDKQKTTKQLLDSGASIHEINTIRKHLSRIKGGGLGRMIYPATLVSLILSDVIGNDLDVIASGPTIGDSSTFQDCLSIVGRYGMEKKIPQSVRNYLKNGAAGKHNETPKPDDPIFEKTRNIIIGSNIQCLEAAEKKAQSFGYSTLILSSFIEGETKEIARMHAALLKEILTSRRPLAPPACLITGGETTVTIRGNGKGGRNQEFVLAGARELADWKGAAIFSAGTDGNDGPTDAAGAYGDWTTMERGRSLGLDPNTFLENNDSYHFFLKMKDLIVTGPTNTNVMDLRLLIARP